MGQASTYTPEVGAQICDRLAAGVSLLAACREIGCSYGAAKGWEVSIPEHAANSARARETGCHALADQCIEIADDSRNDWIESAAEDGDERAVAARANGEQVQRSRLRIDTRLRLLGKWLPKVYGDRQTTELVGAGGGPIKTAAVTLTDADLERIAKGAP